MTTLLIEKLNENQTSFIDYICSVKENSLSLTDEEVQTIRKALVVRSMEELTERFLPQVNVRLMGEQITILLCYKDGFYRNIVSLWETISQGKYSDITSKDLENSLLAAEGVSEEEFVKAQEQIFVSLQERKPQKAKAQVEACIEGFEDTLFLIKRLLVQAERFLQKNKTKHRRFVVETEEGMSLQRVAVSEAFLQSSYHSRGFEEKYQKLLEEVFQEAQDKEENAQKAGKKRLLYWNLLLACQNLTKQKQEELERVFAEQKVIYKEARDSFWYQAKPLLQTMLNCYFYFQKQEAGELLITNCTVEELANDRCQKALLRYLETVNRKQYREDAVVKAILPNIEEKKKKEKLTRERFAAASKEVQTHNTNELKTAEALQNTFAEFEIETRMIRCDEGEMLGYTLTGIDVYSEDAHPKDELQELTIWLNEWRLWGEER